MVVTDELLARRVDAAVFLAHRGHDIRSSRMAVQLKGGFPTAESLALLVKELTGKETSPEELATIQAELDEVNPSLQADL